VLELKQVSLSYNDEPLLIDIDLTMHSGQWLAMLGRSGCGKSSLLKAIAGLDNAATQTGSILYQGSFAYMAQQDSLLPWLSVINNVLLERRLNGSVTTVDTEQAQRLLDQVGLSEFSNKVPYELSGGQRQRVALARTLMQDADLILMDEPFSAVDAITRLELQKLASELLQEKTVMLITHDPQEAIRLAEVIYVIQNDQLSEPYFPEGARPRFASEQAQPSLEAQLLEALTI